MLVEALSEAIVPLLDRPFAFFGHSMGGIVIFELAQLLQRSHLPRPEALFVSGCAAPHLLRSEPATHALPDQEFIDALRKLNGMPAELLNLPEAMELFLPSLRADFETIERYQFAPGGLPLNCRILAFGGLDDTHITSDQLKGWGVHTDSGFRSQYFPGDHFFLNTARESILACIAAEMNDSASNAN